MSFYFDFDNYFKMIRLARKEKLAQVRYYYLFVLCIWVPIASSFHAICFFLDGVFFPGLRKIEVRQPIFMVGHARSGTTLTHRLLSKDADRFSSFVLYELYFPSLLQKKLIRAVARLDSRLFGGFLEKRVRAWEERRYGKMRHIHKMGLTIPEEDDIVLYYSMASGFWITKMPYMGDLDFYHMNDWPERKRKRVNDFYRECVRRQLYLNGPDRIHLSKNPLYSGRVASLIEAFPDARFVVNVRDPDETIPSLLKLMTAGWKQLGWEEERQRPCLKVLADQSWHTYLHPLEMLEAHPEIRGSVVDYRDLTSDPAAAIEQIYKDLDLPLTSEYRELLAAEGKRAREHKSRHTYSLEEFGLEKDAIRIELAELFERFQWDAAEAGSSGEGDSAAEESTSQGGR
ncbi:MAG: sulfotransferase [Deltaproteobacteria bacterium]|nr:sulfotransferase [Deltaproteobacteria bacterium]MBW2418706.1 sulfotransferase [Deltaproteobacteria bacterium]